MDKTGQNPTDNGQDRIKPYRQWTRQDKTLQWTRQDKILQTMDKTGQKSYRQWTRQDKTLQTMDKTGQKSYRQWTRQDKNPTDNGQDKTEQTTEIKAATHGSAGWTGVATESSGSSGSLHTTIIQCLTPAALAPIGLREVCTQTD